MNWKPIATLAKEVQSGKTTAVSLVEASLARCNQASEYNALISINEDALTKAKEIDSAVAEGKTVGKLAGVPFVAKDNFLTKGVRTTAASNILADFVPPFDATAIKKLEDEGAILVAKANLDSFAHGASTENSDMGVTKNPHDIERVPGGSSGGSAAAVVLGMAPFALGTDTGGSIRLPASFTGSVGLKPTYGLVSRYGVVAMASSTDVIGPITMTVADSAYVLDVLAGRDQFDATTIERDQAAYTDLDGLDLKGKTIGIVSEQMGEGVDTEVANTISDIMKKAEAAGAKVTSVSIPDIDKALSVYYIVMPAEVSSNLSRYDGIRYGYSDPEAKSIDDVYVKSRTNGFNNEVKRRIMIGTYVLSSGYYDAYYKKAQQVRTLLIKEFEKVFEEVDFLVGPVSPTTAFKIGENTDDPLKMYLVDIMTTAPNLVGIPAISVPIAKDSNKLPIGLHIMAPARHDRAMLGLAQAIESIAGYES